MADAEAEKLLSEDLHSPRALTNESCGSECLPTNRQVTVIGAVPKMFAADCETHSDQLPADTSDSDALHILLQASAAAESLQSRFSELQQRRAELNAAHQQLQLERAAFEQGAQQFATEVARDRTLQREMQAELEQRLARVADQEKTLERGLADLRSDKRALSEERVILKQAVRTELAEERERLEQQQRLLDAEQKNLQELQDACLCEHADRLELLNAELQTERERLAESLRDELAAELAQLSREKLEWQQQRELQQTELRQQAEDLQQQRELFGEQLETERTRLRDELEKRRQMLLTEQSNLQRRYRFQFEHLGRAREDLEVELRELRREQQVFRADRQRFTELHRLRLRQLEKVRQRLADRDASLQKEQRIHDRSRSAANAELTRLKRRSEEECEAMLQEAASRQRQLRQQESTLAELATRLEERSQRLGQLRSELDRTQAEILEQRLIVEETRAALFRDPMLAESARARLEQSRGDVQVFFDRMKAQLNAERERIQSSASDLADRQMQFRRDRTELEEWFADRESTLHSRCSESVVDGLQQTIQALQAQLGTAEERRAAEQQVAERTIRDLLDQLTGMELADLELNRAVSLNTSRDAADTSRDAA